MTISVLGTDLGKNSCSLVALDEKGTVVMRRRMRPDGIPSFTALLNRCVVAMEACCGAHHLGRLLKAKCQKTVAPSVAIVGEAVPGLTTARDLLDRLRRIIQHRTEERFERWIEAAKLGLTKSFAPGIVQDHAAVKDALAEPWTIGQTVTSPSGTLAGARNSSCLTPEASQHEAPLGRRHRMVRIRTSSWIDP